MLRNIKRYFSVTRDPGLPLAAQNILNLFYLKNFQSLISYSGLLWFKQQDKTSGIIGI